MMVINGKLRTELIKKIEKKYPNAAILYQDIWMHAAELFMDDTDEPPINNEEVQFLEYAYSVIKERGADLDSYSEQELVQVHAMLISSIHLNREDLIDKAGLSKDFAIKIEGKLEQLGHSFM